MTLEIIRSPKRLAAIRVIAAEPFLQKRRTVNELELRCTQGSYVCTVDGHRLICNGQKEVRGEEGSDLGGGRMVGGKE